jgi:DNA-binding response OmpR family regulator
VSRILIVDDDDQALTRSLQIHLTAADHTVRTTHTLAEAWSQFCDDPPGALR